MARAAPAPVSVQVLRSGAVLSGKRLLGVDDHAVNRQILERMTTMWGMVATTSASPLQALAWLRDGRVFDVAVLDHQMPEMDGVALAREIRTMAGAPRLPLILLTSVALIGSEDIAKADLSCVLLKPVKQSSLFDRLHALFAPHVRTAGVPGPVPADADPVLAAGLPLRILIAEDNAVNQKVAQAMLRRLGYAADLAADGLEVLAALAVRSYDVILMDVQMPQLDGLEATREICRRWPGRRPRIIAMTANAMQGDRALCLDAGMDDYMAKPVRREDLVAALQRCRAPVRDDVP